MDKLTQTLLQEDTVLFIGSGISLWSGLPTWTGLIEMLARFIENTPNGSATLVREEAKRGYLLQAASYGFSKLSTHQIGQFIKEACSYTTATPSEIHKKIVSLGPTCYITTNYDTLIEDSIRRWCPNSNFRAPITNKQLLSTADIVQASARDFVFKLHGDANDSESIILTREQYGQLLPGGKLNVALKAAETLLTSRPVIYIGFGLRDPDFSYLQDLLRNTYEGGVRDHYAIIPNVGAEEIDYWRSQYGIHLISYSTSRNNDGSPNHSELLVLLDKLIANVQEEITPSATLVANAAISPEETSAMFVLALARYAAKLMKFKKAEPELPIKVYESFNKKNNNLHQGRFNGLIAEKFLVDGPDKALFIGLPGAGKSYSIKRAAAHLCEILHRECLQDVFVPTNVTIPFVIDLKQYNGDLWEMLRDVLPTSVKLEDIIDKFSVKIYLDSFNEMPREYRESGHFEADFSDFIHKSSRASLIIGSRTTDGLTNLGLATYDLRQIDIRFIEAELLKGAIVINGIFEKEIKELLQKPLYFQLINSGAIKLSNKTHPREIYKSFFANLSNEFARVYNVQFDLENALSLAAYSSIDRGEEAQPTHHFLQTIEQEIARLNIRDITASEVANWLVSKSIIIPYPGNLVAYFHQSATEYLAACELARRYQSSPSALKNVLKVTRWDQALFLTLSMLPTHIAEDFLNEIISIDFELALSAVKYLEYDREHVVSKLLIALPEDASKYRLGDRKHDRALSDELPISESHIPQLWNIVKYGNTLAGAALTRLWGFEGVINKERLLELLFQWRLDHNFARNSISIKLRDLVEVEDINTLRKMADAIPERNIPSSMTGYASGFATAVGHILTKFELFQIKEHFIPNYKTEGANELVSSVLANALIQFRSNESLELARELLVKGSLNMASIIASLPNIGNGDNSLSWRGFSERTIDFILDSLSTQYYWHKSSLLKALFEICKNRNDLAKHACSRANYYDDLKKSIICYHASINQSKLVLKVLLEIDEQSVGKINEDSIDLLSYTVLNWKGQGDLFMRLLKIKNTKFSMAILRSNSQNASMTYNSSTLGVFTQYSFDDIIALIKWASTATYHPNNSIVKFTFAFWLFYHFDKTIEKKLIDLFNDEPDEYKKMLSRWILPLYKSIALESLSEASISFLISDLSNPDAIHNWMPLLLENIASELFVFDRIVPLIASDNKVLSTNAAALLRKVGAKHGRRYILN